MEALSGLLLRMLLAVPVFFACSLAASAADLSVTSDTLFQFLERDTPKGNDQQVAPIYDYLSVDYQDTENGGFSLHAYGWARADMAGSDYFSDDPDGELAYAYIQYAKPYSPWQIRLGRQHIFAGVTDDSVDGLSVVTGWRSLVSVSAFGGVPAAFDTDNGTNGDVLAGGRLAIGNEAVFLLGLSAQYLTDDSQEIDNKAGVDTTIALGNVGDIHGLSSYNYDSNRWQEHRYEAYVRMGPVVLKPLVHHFRYNDYFGERGQRDSVFGYLNGTDETLTLFGADGNWSPAGWVTMGLRYRRYAYRIRNDGANYYALLGRAVSDNDREIGFEAGRMDGATDETAYTLSRIYGHLPNPLGLDPKTVLTADFQWVRYDQPIFDQDHAYTGSMSAGRSFFHEMVLVKATGVYSRNPYYDQDVRMLITLRIVY